MPLVDEATFEKICGRMMPLRRNMSIFDGDKFQCACGDEHTFNTLTTLTSSEGLNGRFVIACPNGLSYISLIKTKMKFGLIYQGLEYLAGCKVNN